MPVPTDINSLSTTPSANSPVGSVDSPSVLDDHARQAYAHIATLRDSKAPLAFVPAGTGAVPSTVQNKLRETVSVKDFGATGDGGSDDTAAIQAAVDSISVSGTLTFPDGTYKITSSILCDDKFVSFVGGGVSSCTIKYSPSIAGVAFDLRHTVSNDKAFSFRDLSIITDYASAGTAIKITAKLTGEATQVNGENDSLFIRNVRITQTGSGYWTTFIHAVHNGGMHLSNSSFDNTITTAQANSSVAGIILECTDARVSTIRTITANDFYILRTADAIKLIGNATTQIESIYFSSGEIVGVSGAAIKVASGQVGAFGFSDVHFDCNQYVIDSRLGRLLIGHFNGCDFRKTATGGTNVNCAMFAIDAGEMISFSGCQMSGYNHLSTSVDNKAFLFSNSYSGQALYRCSVTGCTFKNLYYVFGASLNCKINSSGNAYNVIEGRVLEDDNLDNSIALRDAMVSKTITASLDNTGTATVSVTVPGGYFGHRWPVAILQSASSTGTDDLSIYYSFDTSTLTQCNFVVTGNTTARTVRFSFMAMGTNEGVVLT